MGYTSYKKRYFSEQLTLSYQEFTGEQQCILLILFPSDYHMEAAMVNKIVFSSESVGRRGHVVQKL